jgi:predicted nucleic acid-binding protein
MRMVFADTSFWLARIIPKDQWSHLANEAAADLGRIHIVTSDFVLFEVLNALSRRGPEIRTEGIEFVRAVTADSHATVVEASRKLLLESLDLYQRRGDKDYSLTDCASMVEMRRRLMREILTTDLGFEQEGFTILMKR